MSTAHDDETGIEKERFPATSPYSLEQAPDDGCFPHGDPSA